MVQFQYNYSTSLQLQGYSLRALELQSLRATDKQLQRQTDTGKLQSHRASLQLHSYTATNSQSRTPGCKCTEQSYRQQNLSGKYTTVHVIVGQF